MPAKTLDDRQAALPPKEEPIGGYLPDPWFPGRVQS
jgi:hypothetical protein